MNNQARLILIFSVILVLFFQNCTKNTALTSVTQASFAAKESGNGTGYGGKPDPKFYRYVPGFYCDGNLSAKSILTPNTDGNYTLNTCGELPKVLMESEILKSPFDSHFIMYDDFLYSFFEYSPKGIPSRLAELLCRDNFEDPKVEIIAHYDSTLKKSELKFYGSDEILGAAPKNYQPSRMYSNQSIIYQDESLNITVDLGSAKEPSHRYKGIWTRGTKVTPLTCVTGAGLEASVWPIKKEIPFPIAFTVPFKTTSGSFLVKSWAQQLLTFSSTSGVNNFSDTLQISNTNYWINPEKDEIVAIDRGTMNYRYFYVNLKKPDRIEIPLPSWGNLTTSAYLLSGFSGNHIFIRGYTDSDFLEQVLYAFNTETHLLTTVFQTKKWGPITQLKNPDRLVFTSEEDSVPKINVIDMKDLTVKTFASTQFGISNFKCILSGRQFFALKDPNQILLNSINCDYVDGKTQVSSKVYKLNLNDIQSSVIAVDKAIRWQKDTTDFFLLCDISFGGYYGGPVCKEEINQVLSGESGEILNLKYPIVGRGLEADNQPYIEITEDLQKNKYALSKYLNETVLVQISADLKGTIEVCSELKESKLKLSEAQGSGSFLFTKNETTQSFKVYAVEQGKCRYLNQFPATQFLFSNVIATEKGFGVSLTYDNRNKTSLYEMNFGNQLLFVPIDGKAPILLNPLSKGITNLDALGTSHNGKLIYLRGREEISRQAFLFSFQIP